MTKANDITLGEVHLFELDFNSLAIQYPGLRSFIYLCKDNGQSDQLIDLLFALETDESYGGGN